MQMLLSLGTKKQFHQCSKFSFIFTTQQHYYSQRILYSLFLIYTTTEASNAANEAMPPPATA